MPLVWQIDLEAEGVRVAERTKCRSNAGGWRTMRPPTQFPGVQGFAPDAIQRVESPIGNARLDITV